MALSDAEIGMFSINLRKTIKGFFLEKKQAGEPGYNLDERLHTCNHVAYIASRIVG